VQSLIECIDAVPPHQMIMETGLLTAVDSRTNPASTAGTAQHDLDLVSG